MIIFFTFLPVYGVGGRIKEAAVKLYVLVWLKLGRQLDHLHNSDIHQIIESVQEIKFKK
jgi:hypothetical protein